MENRFQNSVNCFSKCVGRNCFVQLRNGFCKTSAGTLKRAIRALEMLSAISSVKFSSFKFNEDTREINNTMVLLLGRYRGVYFG